MWIVPNWAQAVDGLARTFEQAEEGQKSAAHTHSLPGRRGRSTALIVRVITTLSAGDPGLTELLNVYSDLLQVGLRELHAQPLIARPDDNACRQIFFCCWGLPLLDSLRQQAIGRGPQAELINDINALLHDYYYPQDGAALTADRLLNRRISPLLPRGACAEFKREIHRGKLRGLFSLADNAHRVRLAALKAEIEKSGVDEAEAAACVADLRRLFRAGAVLRSLEKWHGPFDPRHRLQPAERACIGHEFSPSLRVLLLFPQQFLAHFSATVAIWRGRLGHQDFDVTKPYADYSDEEQDRFWPMLMQRVLDNMCVNFEQDQLPQRLHGWCKKFAPARLRGCFAAGTVSNLAATFSMLDLLTTDPDEIQRACAKNHKAVFTELKNMVVMLHQQQQLGHHGTRLASVLIACALSGEQRLTEHELTPLLNVLVDNLSADGSLFPLYPALTPFGLLETPPQREIPAPGESFDKDDCTRVYAMALCEYNRYPRRADPVRETPVNLGYPFARLDRILRELFDDDPDLTSLDARAVQALFRREKIRIRDTDSGSPCWRLSDAGPYAILRNLSMYLPLLGLENDEYVGLGRGLAHYYHLAPAAQRRLLRAIDERAWREDLRRWWAARTAPRAQWKYLIVDGQQRRCVNGTFLL